MEWPTRVPLRPVREQAHGKKRKLIISGDLVFVPLVSLIIYLGYLYGSQRHAGTKKFANVVFFGPWLNHLINEISFVGLIEYELNSPYSSYIRFDLERYLLIWYLSLSMRSASS